MRPRTCALLGAAALVVAGAVVAVVLVPRHAASPAAVVQQVTPPQAAPAPQRAVTPLRTPATGQAPSTPATPKTSAPVETAPATVAPVTSAQTPSPSASEGYSLRIDSPADGKVYHSTVPLAGRIVPPKGIASLSAVRSASWSITGTDRWGSFAISADGSFHASVPTEGLRSAQTLVVQAAFKDATTTEASVSLVDDGRGPGVVVSSPQGMGSYGSTAKVTGVVKGPEDVAEPLAEVASVSWALEGSKLGDDVTLAKDGSFSFSFSTVGEKGDLVIDIAAVDRNGRSTTATVSFADRSTGPSIRIDSPADSASYADTVSVNGRVGDPADPSGLPSDVKSMSWRLIGASTRSGDVPFQKDGSFRFSFSAQGLSGGQVLELKAVDLNGRTSLRTLALRSPAPAAAASQGEAPALTITSPVDGSTYGASITVSGKATNSASDTGTNTVSKVAWSIAGTKLSGASDIGADGSFSFTVSTAGLSGTQALSVVATGGGGATVEKLVVLQDDLRGIPIALSSPANGGYYKDATSVEGQVGDGTTTVALRSLSYDVPGKPALGGRLAADASGKFKVSLPSSQVSGDITVRVTAEDLRGHASTASILLHDGRLKPVIVVTAPAQGSAFGSLLRVAGKVNDPYAGQAGMAGIDTVNWLVSPVDFAHTSTPARGTSPVGTDGVFRFSLPTATLSGPQDITLTAIATNGNRGELTVRVIPGDGDVPAFSVVPADRRITISWSPAAFATRYDLSWTTGAEDPEKGRTTTNASSPVVLTGLDNGSLYSIRMQVRFDDGATGSSTLVRAIPLSAQTLAPVVKGDYMQIKLSWDTIGGADSYDVWRAAAGTTTFAKIASSIRVAGYTDTSVDFGKDYTYQISPAGVLAPVSATATGRSLAFPSEKLAHVGAAAESESRRVTVSGGYAFLSAGSRGVRIIDVSNPAGPVDVGSMQTDNAWDVAVKSGYAYVADGESGLRVLDISAPRTPVLLGSRKTSDARAVVCLGDYAIVADGDKGVKVIDISDTHTLNRLGTLDTSNALGVAVSGGKVLLADGVGGLKVLDVSKPAVPAIIGSLATTDARSVATQGGIAVVADGAAGLRVVDVKDLRNPKLLATFAVGMASSVALADGYAYVTDGTTGVKVIDLADPTHPALFTSHAFPGAADVSVEDRMAYIAETSGLELMRVQIQGKSFRVGAAETGGKAFAISVAGNWAYVASHSLGLRVLNVADPSRLSDASSTGALTTRFAVAVNVADKMAFVADGTNGVRIVDVSPSWDAKKPGPPVDVGSYRPGGSVNRVFPVGTLAYVAAGEQGVRVLDVSTPSAPSEIGSVRSTNAEDIVVQGTWAYVADGDGGVRVVDVSTPAKPVMLPAVIPGRASSLALSGSLLFSAGNAGVSVIDISDPGAPALKGRYDTGYAEAISASGNYVYVAEGFRGLTVIDVFIPTRPLVVSSCDDVYAVGVAVKGDYAIVADSVALRVIRILIPDWLTH